MIFAFSLFVLLVMTKTKVILCKSTYNENYLDKIYTTQINGFFVFIIMLNHFASSVTSIYAFDRLYLMVQHLNQCVVVSFLFYSGFGIFEQYKMGGGGYLNKLLTRKIPYCLFIFDCFTIIHISISLITRQNIDFNVCKILLLFMGYDNIGNLNWYIFYILLNYFFAFCIFSLNIKAFIKIFLIFILNTIYVLCLWKLKNEEYWFYATSFLFPLGMLFNLNKDKIDTFVNKHYCFFLILSFLLYFVSAIVVKILIKDLGLVFNLISVFFMAMVLLLSKKIILNSKILNFLGRNVFIIYNIQMIPIYFLKCIDFEIDRSNYLFLLPMYILYIVGTTFLINLLKKES